MRVLLSASEGRTVGFRRWGALGVVASFFLVMSCGDSGSRPATTAPLQSEKPGVTETRLTKKQMRDIIKACNDAAEIGGSQDPCSKAVIETINKNTNTNTNANECGPHDPCLTVHGLPRPDSDEAGFIEITDNRSRRKSLCESGPDHVCLRIGVKTSSVLDQIIETARSTTSSTGTPTSAETLTPTSTETAPTTSPVQPQPRMPEPTSAPTGSP